MPYTDPPYNEFIVGGLVTDPQKTWNLFRNIFTNTLMTMGFAKDEFIHFQRARVLWKCMNKSLAEPVL